MEKKDILHKHCPFKNVSGNNEYYLKEILDAMEQYANEQTISLIKAMKKGGKSYAYNVNQWLKDNDINLKYDEI